MQARLIRQLSKRNPAFSIKAAIAVKQAGGRYNIPHSLPVEIGTIIDHPDAWKLVANGVALPEDDECRARCAERGLDAEKLEAAQAAQDRIAEESIPDDEEFGEFEPDDEETL